MTDRIVQVTEPKGGLQQAERETPEPRPGQVRVRVEACGVCHSDVMTAYGMATSYPRVPGHEVAGVVDAVGDGVKPWTEGQRVGVGWFGGACGSCPPCRDGDMIECVRMGITGLTRDGGYADTVVVPADALAAIPDGLSAVDAAPLMCAGVTTFNALRNSSARPGDRVAVLGVGGLGHLAVQFAARAGFETVAIARGQEKRSFAEELGASSYIDSTETDPAEALQDLGGARVVLATVTNGPAMAGVVGGLAPRGELLVLGVPQEPLEVPAVQLIQGSRSIVGHASGTAKDSEDTLRFAALHGITPQTEEMPLEQAQAGFDRMLANEARFRVVLTT